MAKIALLDAIQDATDADLEAIDQEITTLEKRLGSLRIARSLVSVQLHGPPQKIKRAPGAKAPATRDEAGDDSLAAKIYDLIHAEGPLPANAIAQRLGKSPQAIGITCAKSGWFTRSADGDWHIAKTGGAR